MRHSRNWNVTVARSAGGLTASGPIQTPPGCEPVASDGARRYGGSSVSTQTPVRSGGIAARIGPRIKQGLSRAEWTRLGGMFAVIVALHVIGWFIIIALVAPHHYAVGTKTFGIGIGLTAYTLGMRHAFDADHIAAIDNTTRKLMGDGKRPLSVGFWFSLGHSSIVFAPRVPAVTWCQGTRRPGEERHLGVAPLHRTHRHSGLGDVPLRHRRDQRDHPGRDHARLPRHATRCLRRGDTRAPPGQSRPDEPHSAADHEVDHEARARCTAVGLLFGLGFDTATEVSLLVLAAAGAASALPWYGILCAADPLRRRHVPVRHDRRHVHELRVRLGLLQAGAQGLLQHHDH